MRCRDNQALVAEWVRRTVYGRHIPGSKSGGGLLCAQNGEVV